MRKSAENFMPSVRPHQDLAHAGGIQRVADRCGYRSGDTVSPYYDAMLAKVIAWAPTRDVAIERLNRGLEDTDVRGIVTNIPFLSALVTHPQVRANTIDTGFIERELKNLTASSAAPGDLELCAAVAAIVSEEQKAARGEAHSPWQALRSDAGWTAAAGVLVPAGAGRRAQGRPALWQRAVDIVDRRPGISLCILTLR